MTADPIAAARAMIEPLTGYTPEPWEANINDKYGFIMVPLSGYDGDFKPEDARLIAAAPDLRDMVATLADALEAERAKVAAAYEAAAREVSEWTEETFSAVTSADEAAEQLRALTPADAQAALDKLLAEARLEGRKIERQAQDAIFRRVNPSFGFALPEPKETNHD